MSPVGWFWLTLAIPNGLARKSKGRDDLRLLGEQPTDLLSRIGTQVSRIGTQVVANKTQLFILQ